MQEILILFRDIPQPFKPEAVKELCEHALEQLSVSDYDISVVFTNDAVIRKYNKEFRMIDEATDVLSFPVSESPDEKNNILTGDIMISMDSLFKNCKNFNVWEGEELKRLLVHGLMHLAGHEHSSNDFEKEDMLRVQEQLVKKLSGEKLF